MKFSWSLLVIPLVWAVVSWALQSVAGWPSYLNYLALGLIVAYLPGLLVRMHEGKGKSDDFGKWLVSSVFLFVAAFLLSFVPGFSVVVAFIVALAVVYSAGQAVEQEGIQKLIPALFVLALLLAPRLAPEMALWALLPAAYVLISPTLEGLEAWRKA